MPVLPLLGGGLARAGHSRRCRPAWAATSSSAAATARSQTEIRKLRQAWTEKKPVEWVRVHYLARHAHFPHQRHIKALGPTACATCHGDVSRMPQVFKVNKVDNMGFCITLPHRAEGVAGLFGMSLLSRESAVERQRHAGRASASCRDC